MKLVVSIVFSVCLLFGSIAAQIPGNNVDSAKTRSAIEIVGEGIEGSNIPPVVSGPEIWKDPSQPLNARVIDLVRRMSLAEKTTQLLADAPAISRLGVHVFSYRNECIHGLVAREGVATIFPQVIGMAATWNPQLIGEEADVIATEARAHFNDYTLKHNGNSIIHEGISFYAPNINIVRDPRWGRGQETYGEDPFLTTKFALAFIKGLQGSNPKYLKALATAKHFAVHSGPEPLRRSFNVVPSKFDLYNTYLPAFEASIKKGHVFSVMGAYNALYGVPACADSFLLTKLLRQQLGFNGFVVSDGGAIRNIWVYHKYVTTAEEAAAVAVKAGCDLFSSSIAKGNYPISSFEAMNRMLKKNLLSEIEIDSAVTRTYRARFELGLFDPPSMVPWSKITLKQNDTPEHRALALKVAQESIVLLKNNGLLPLDKTKIKRIAVVGPNAASEEMLAGNYNGKASHWVSILNGIKKAAGKNIEITYEEGCPLALKNDNSNAPTPKMTTKAVESAKYADVVIFVGGLDATLEREQHKVHYQGFDGGDRTQIELPSVQENLLKKLYATGKPVVLVNCTGSAVALNWENENLQAIIQAWYPGEEGGTAVADVLFGNYNPAGRLPVTFYKSVDQLPPFTDYDMANRTYRYFKGEPLYPFGYGLSYTTFKYSGMNVDKEHATPEETLTVSVNVKNTGSRSGEEVVQVYAKDLSSNESRLVKSLVGFKRIALKKNQTKTIIISIPIHSLRYYNVKQEKYVIEPGKYELQVGSSSRDINLREVITVL